MEKYINNFTSNGLVVPAMLEDVDDQVLDSMGIDMIIERKFLLRKIREVFN